MRDPAPIQHVDYFWWSLWIFVGSFVAQNVLGVWFGLGDQLYAWLGLSVDSVVAGRVWSIFTYSLLHANLMHFLMNGVMLFILGRYLARELPPRQYLHLIFGSIFLGGLAALGFNALGGAATHQVTTVGFSAAICGMLTAMLLTWPQGKITMYFFFVAPVELNPRTLLKVLVGFNVFGLLFVDLAPILGREPTVDASTAFTAHLGGMLAGYIFYRVLQRPAPVFTSAPRERVTVEAPSWSQKPHAVSPGKMKVNLTSRQDVQREVDRILDKINREGFGSLSDEEQKILDEAGDLLKK